MSVRNWGAGAEIRVPANNDVDQPGDFSFVAKIKPLSFPSANQVIMAGVTPDGIDRWRFGINATGQLFWGWAHATTFGTTETLGPVLTLNEWQTVGFSGIGMVGLRRFHIQSDDGTWSHASGLLSGTLDPMLSIADGYLTLGRNLNCNIACIALFDTWIDDAPFEAMGENDASLDITTFTPRPVCAFNFDQTTVSEQIPDLMGNVETIVGAITDASDFLGIEGTTIVDSSDLTWNFTVPPPPLDIQLRFSGGATNTDPLVSHGGAMSDNLALNPVPNFSRIQVLMGTTFYVCVYVFNNEDGNETDVGLYIDSTDLATGVTASVGVAAEAAGVPVAATANSQTAPAGVTFSAPTVGAPLNMGTLGALEGRGVWIRIVVATDSPGAIHNNVGIGFAVDPL